MAEKTMTGNALAYFSALQSDLFLGVAGVEAAEAGARYIDG